MGLSGTITAVENPGTIAAAEDDPGAIAAVENDPDHEGWVAALVQAIKDGRELDFAPGEDVDSTQAANWPESRRLPGEALRAALLEPDVRPDPRGLLIRGAYITGLTDLADLRVPYGLDFESCAFELPARWPGLRVADLHLHSCATPTLTLNGANIDGMLQLDGLTANEVWAPGSTIGGRLHLGGATLTNGGGFALFLDGAYIKGDAYLRSMTATGTVRTVGATIGGTLDMQDATLANPGGIAMQLDRADIKGSAMLNPVTVTGELLALGVKIGGQLNLKDATLTNPGGKALDLERADIKGHALLSPVTVTGKILAAGATIGGQFALRGATLTNERGEALVLDGADIKGDAMLDLVAATGMIRGLAATIGGQLDLTSATLTNKGGMALALTSARLGHLRLTPAAVKGTIYLKASEITLLSTPDDMQVLTSGELSASGWRLGDVAGRIRHDRKAAAKWLSRDNAADEFVPQPWHELASVYERNGQPADARWMRRKAAQGVTRTSPWWLKPIRWLYGGLTGHGYSPLRAAGWLILAIVASGLIVAANAAVFTPTATNKAAWKTPPPIGQPAPPITGAVQCSQLQDRSSCLNPVLYAFDNALPGTLATGQAAQWTANGAVGSASWVPYALGFLKITSWIFVALLLAGVTGLLRKT
jgi:hypothetical protein